MVLGLTVPRVEWAVIIPGWKITAGRPKDIALQANNQQKYYKDINYNILKMLVGPKKKGIGAYLRT